MNDQITYLSQNIWCESPADCEALAVGDKPCGGPGKYIVSSKKNSNATELKDVIQRYTDLDRKLNASNGSAGTCDIILEPTVDCIENTCTQQN